MTLTISLHGRWLSGQNDDSVGEIDRLVDIVRDEQDRLAGFLPQLDDLLAQPRARIVVERGKRLVHQHDVGIERERPGDGDALTFAARQHGRHLVRIGRETDAGEFFAGALAPGGDAHLRLAHFDARKPRCRAPISTAAGAAPETHKRVCPRRFWVPGLRPVRRRPATASGRRSAGARLICRSRTGRAGRQIPVGHRKAESS